MHFKSRPAGGYTVYAVSGTNTVSFGIDYSKAKTKGLLGFSVERIDPTEDQQYFMYGFKVFESVIPHPDENTTVSTFDHPIQSFVWDDFTAKPDREYRYIFHPVKGTPKNLDRSAKPIEIGVRTEPLFSKDEHDVFFNRGVASSQAYARKFNNRRPDAIEDPDERAEALEWLSRQLDDALLGFIDNAKKGDTLLGCFYEFRYRPVADRLRDARKRGVNVRLILDAKDNAKIDKKTGKKVESFPAEENRRMVADAKLPRAMIARWREGNPSDIQHNKFMVLVKKGKTATEVWTGSTNLSDGGIHGQTNVGHWVRNENVADQFRLYWELLRTDPGSAKGDDRTTSTSKKAEFRKAVGDLMEVPTAWEDIPKGVTPVFSPRKGLDVLKMYVTALDDAKNVGCVTLAFTVNKLFKTALANNSSQSAITFIMLEKQDRPNPDKPDEFVELTAEHNVYQAFGSFIRDPLYQWTKETNAKVLQLNQHVSYIHSKFLLKDPLSRDPIVITGSANFSDDSTNANDENMLLIRGSGRAADIYFTEFNRLFFHYYFRSIRERLDRMEKAGITDAEVAAAEKKGSLFLDEGDHPKTGWLTKYKAGSLKAKRVAVFTAMHRPQII